MEDKKDTEKRPFGVPKTDVYRVNPTFTLSLNMLEEYRQAIMDSIMHNRFVLMRDGRTLKWIDELIMKEKAANPKKAKEKINPEVQ